MLSLTSKDFFSRSKRINSANDRTYSEINDYESHLHQHRHLKLSSGMTGSQQRGAPSFGFRGMTDMAPRSAFAGVNTMANINISHQHDASDGYRPVSPDLAGLGTSTGYSPQSPNLTSLHAVPAARVENPLNLRSYGGREVYTPPTLDNPLFDGFSAAKPFQHKQDVHDALINQQLQHFSYAKTLSKNQRSRAMKGALEAPISKEHQAALAASMRAAFETAPEPTQTPPSPRTSKPQEEPYSVPYYLRRDKTYKIGDHQVTDEEFAKLLLDHSNADLALTLGVTQQAVCDRRRYTLKRESKRTGLPYDELSTTLTEARRASGAMASQKGVPKGPRRPRIRNSEVDSKQTTAAELDDKIAEPATTHSSAVQQRVKLVDYPASDDEDEMDSGSQSEDEMDTAPSTPVENARAAIQAKEASAQAIRQKMEVSALLNSEDDDKMDTS